MERPTLNIKLNVNKNKACLSFIEFVLYNIELRNGQPILSHQEYISKNKQTNEILAIK
jgi:hypothetical protein